MKKFTLFIVSMISICFLNDNAAYSQMPEYTLEARNLTLNSPDDNAVEFDIYIRRTNSCFFAYAKGRYEFFFNPAVANGGKLTYSFVDGFSDLPECMQPVNAYCENNKLIMHYNSNTESEMLFLISGSFPGTRICRMRLETSAPIFSTEYLGLRWNNPGSGASPRTRVFAYVLGIMMHITSPETHSVDSSGFGGGPLPVDLSGFTSSVMQNDVSLRWTTNSEINNLGFDIERSTENESFEKVGFVQGNGNSNSINNYSFNDQNLNSGNYYYRLKQIDLNGNFKYYNLQNEILIGIPEQFSLSQNYPNPFNPSTAINYEIAEDSKVSLILFDLNGKEVRKLFEGNRQSGYYNLSFNASGLSSGMYFYTLSARGSAKNFSSTKKMMLIK